MLNHAEAIDTTLPGRSAALRHTNQNLSKRYEITHYYSSARVWKITTTAVLDKDENLLWSGLQWHWSRHGSEMTALPILLAAVYLGSGNFFYKIVHKSFILQ